MMLQKYRRGLFIGGAICAGAIFLALPGIPWLRPEITETAQVITFSEGSCVVETVGSNVINIADCDNKAQGEQVMVKYRAQTKVGELVIGG